jgi:hypothetical protein
VDVNTGEFKLLAGFGRIASRDQTMFYKVVRSVPGPDSPVTGVVSVDLATGAEAPVATFPEPLEPYGTPGLDLSPDGTTLVIMWADVAESGGALLAARLATIRVDGTGYREIYGPFPVSRTPDLVKWTPDGTAILFVTQQNGRWRVMRIPASGGTPEFDGLESPTQIWNIDVSPDGSQIAFSAASPVTTELWALDGVVSAISDRR